MKPVQQRLQRLAELARRTGRPPELEGLLDTSIGAFEEYAGGHAPSSGRFTEQQEEGLTEVRVNVEVVRGVTDPGAELAARGTAATSGPSTAAEAAERLSPWPPGRRTRPDGFDGIPSTPPPRPHRSIGEHQMERTDAAVATGREGRLVAIFVELADTLVEDFDVVELLYTLTERVVEMSIASEAGILLADEAGVLQYMAASEERTHLLELFQVQNQEGPCQDCFTTGRPVGIPDLTDVQERWPLFAPKALSLGFRSVQAVPLRLRGDILGALNLFLNEPGGIGDEDQLVVQAMGDIATIGLLQQRAARWAATVTDQLQHALHSRIGIEQAKGVISEQSGFTMDASFALLRAHSRHHNRKLSDLARAVVDHEIDARGLSG